MLDVQLLLVSVNSSLDPGLTMFSSSLVTVARNISAPGDVPAIVDLLTQSVEIFLRGNQFENSTFSVSPFFIFKYFAYSHYAESY